MKFLGATAILSLGCIILCCGGGTFLASRSANNADPSDGSPRTASARGEIPPAGTKLSPEAERVFTERTATYNGQLDEWDSANKSLADSEAELASVRLKIDEHKSTKPVAPPHEERQWTTVDRKYKVMATLIATDNEKVMLRRQVDGKEVTVPKAELIAQDRIYVDDAFAASSEFEDALNTWNASNDDLAIQVSALNERIALGSSQRPIAPNRDTVAAEVAAAVAKRKEAERLAKSMADAREAHYAKTQAKSELTTYATILKTVDPDRAMITGLAAEGHELTLTVSDVWHYQPYQIRLQAAQNLWKGWANLHSASDPDKARISIVDQNGNKVGGSRILAGSLIWVQET